MDFQNPLISRIITLALEEDGNFNDITSSTIIDSAQQGVATVYAKQSGIICGLPLIEEINAQCKTAQCKTTLMTTDGTMVQSGTEVARVEGPTQVLLTLERIYLNFLQRLSGVATLTQSFVKIAGNNIILDTRKTTPGLRLLEKYAVVCGGGENHRLTMSDRILVKNNHIDTVGGDFQILKQRLDTPQARLVPIEVEVRDQKELEDTVRLLKPQFVMLDNYSDKDIEDAVDYIRAHAPEMKIEVSGGLNKDRIATLGKKFERLYFSIGALTTQATNIDIAMKIDNVPPHS